jgi:2-oxo-3-hexenedioate decarboxylase
MTTLSTEQQAANARHLLVESYLKDGSEIVGIKISLTSADAQNRVGTDRPIWGWLTNTMEVSNGDVIGAPADVGLRAEAEMVFVLGDDLRGPGVAARDVLAATAAIGPGIELPARYDGAAAPSVTDLIARNALASQFVVGPLRSAWQHLDLSLLGVVMEVDGEPVASGCSANVMGNPAEAIASVANDLAEQREGGLRSGQLIFTGGITPAVLLRPGMTVEANFAHLGAIGISIAAASRNGGSP